MRQIYLFLGLTLQVFLIHAQELTAKIVDAETQEPIPFATVQYSDFDGVMSNEEGVFVINTQFLYANVTKLSFSSLGYKKLEILYNSDFPAIVKLQPDILEISPVAIINKSYTEKEILEKIKDNLSTNYQVDYSRSEIFTRKWGQSNLKEFRFILNESTLPNINQALLDKTFGGLKNKFVSLNEFAGNLVIQDQKNSKLMVNKSLTIQNKEEIATGQQVQKDFLNLMTDNFKSDSNLIIKTGIIRLDKTETVDSLSRKMNDEKDNSEKNKSFTESRNNEINKVLSELFIHSKSDVDFINHSGKYNFTKSGYASYDGNWLYVMTFTPKGSGLYKGKIYVDSETFAIVKAEIEGANPIFDKKLNLFGINANALTYKSTIIFKKVNQKYILKYYFKDNSDEVRIDRPLTVIEKNDNAKGKKRINKVEVQMLMNVVNREKFEMVFDDVQYSNQQDFNNLKPNLNFETTKKNQYDSDFWQGYKILTPEKAIQELKIED